MPSLDSFIVKFQGDWEDSELKKKLGNTFKDFDKRNKDINKSFEKGTLSRMKHLFYDKNNQNIFRIYAKEGGEFLRVVYKINQETKKLGIQSKTAISRKSLAKELNIPYNVENLAQTAYDKQAEEGEKNFDLLISRESNKIKQTRMAISALKKELNSLREQYGKIFAEGGDTSEISDKAVEVNKELAKEEKKLGKQTQIGPMQKLWNSFKRIGFYRIFRAIFAGIKQGFQQGIQSLVQFDKEADKTISSISSSVEKMFGGLTLILMPVIELLAPILESISTVIADIGNSISRASAESKGLTKYSKINLDYMKQTSNEANKLLTSFDKFESLNAKESIWVDGDVQEDKNQGLLSETKIALADIGAILATFGTYKFVSWITSGDAKTFFKDLKTSLSDTKNGITNIASALAFVYAIHEIVSEIINLIDNWDSMSLAQKIKSIVKIALIGIGAILIAVGSLLSAFANPAGVVLKVAGVSAIAVTGILDAVGVFANGGIAEKGNLFIANEKGPELVYSGHNNSSSIMNIAQFKQAMVEALYEASDVFQQYDGSVELSLDGAVIARSKRFKSELNRTNPKLNLK